MPERQAFGVLLISGGHERGHYAFVLATAAAALGREAVLFATNAGITALAKKTDETEERRLRDIGVATLAELRDAAVDLGVRQIACEAGLRIAQLSAEMLLPGVEVAGVATFLASVGQGQIVTI